MQFHELEHEGPPLAEGGTVVVDRRLAVVGGVDLHVLTDEKWPGADSLGPLAAGGLEVGDGKGDLDELGREGRCWHRMLLLG